MLIRFKRPLLNKSTRQPKMEEKRESKGKPETIPEKDRQWTRQGLEDKFPNMLKELQANVDRRVTE